MAEKTKTLSDLAYIQSKLKAPKGQRNKFGDYNYRSCEDILEAVKPLLTERNCTLTISDDIVQVSDRIYVKATATLHTDAGVTIQNTAFAREPLTKKGQDESQITGAASSYARKYALNGLFCIDDNKDADATNTHGKEETAPKPKKTAKASAKKEEEPTAPALLDPFEATSLDQAIEFANNAKDADELVEIWKANRANYGTEPTFVMAVSANPNNPKKR